jgi:hypothetical protein
MYTVLAVGIVIGAALELEMMKTKNVAVALHLCIHLLSLRRFPF